MINSEWIALEFNLFQLKKYKNHLVILSAFIYYEFNSIFCLVNKLIKILADKIVSKENGKGKSFYESVFLVGFSQGWRL